MIQVIKKIAPILIWCVSIQSYAYDFKVDDMYFNILSDKDKTCEITYQTETYYSPYSGDFVIPESVIFGGIEYQVVQIGDYAFYCRPITSVKIPETITTIGASTFQGCTQLSSVSFPEALTTIWGHAFQGCTQLSSVSFPEALTYIGLYAFADCSSLLEIELPDNLSYLGHNLFQNCTQLTKVIIPAKCNDIASGVFYNCIHLSNVICRSYCVPSTSYSFYNATNNSFYGVDLKSCTLEVLEALVPQYQSDNYWGQFGDIKTLPIEYIDTHLNYSAAFSAWYKNVNYPYWELSECVVPTSTAWEEYYQQKLLEGYEFPLKGEGLEAFFIQSWFELMTKEKQESLKRKCSETIQTDDGILYALNQVDDFLSENPSYDIKFFDDYDPNNTRDNYFGGIDVINCPNNADVPNKQYVKISPDGTTNPKVLYTVMRPILKGHKYQVELVTAYNTEEPDKKSKMKFECKIIEFNYDNGSNNYNYGTAHNKVYFETNGEECESKSLSFVANSTTPIFALCIQSTPKPADIRVNYEHSMRFVSIRFTGGDKESMLEELKSLYDEYSGYTFEIGTGVRQYGKEQVQNFNKMMEETRIILLNSSEYDEAAVSDALINLKRAYHLVIASQLNVFQLNDGDDLAIGSSYLYKVANYTRTFDNTDWQPLYVPFGMTYEDWSDDFEVARLNNVHQWDDNDDGTIDRTELEIIKVKSGSIEPNTPYLIRAKSTGEKVLTLRDAMVYPTEENCIDCSSVDIKFTFTGTYKAMGAQELQGLDAFTLKQDKLTAENADDLGSFRWYMTLTDRTGRANNVREVRLFIYDEETGIGSIVGEPNSASILYDLSGRRLSTPQKGIFIQNGKKYLKK